MLNLQKLLEFIAARIDNKRQNEDAGTEIKARLLYRDEDNNIVKVQHASFGFCSGIHNELTVEMNTITTEGLTDLDKRTNSEHRNTRS